MENGVDVQHKSEEIVIYLSCVQCSVAAPWNLLLLTKFHSRTIRRCNLFVGFDRVIRRQSVAFAKKKRWLAMAGWNWLGCNDLLCVCWIAIVGWMHLDGRGELTEEKKKNVNKQRANVHISIDKCRCMLQHILQKHLLLVIAYYHVCVCLYIHIYHLMYALSAQRNCTPSNALHTQHTQHSHHYNVYAQTNRFLIVMCAQAMQPNKPEESEGQSLDCKQTANSNDLLVLFINRKLCVVTTTAT